MTVPKEVITKKAKNSPKKCFDQLSGMPAPESWSKYPTNCDLIEYNLSIAKSVVLTMDWT